MFTRDFVGGLLVNKEQALVLFASIDSQESRVFVSAIGEAIKAEISETDMARLVVIDKELAVLESIANNDTFLDVLATTKKADRPALLAKRDNRKALIEGLLAEKAELSDPSYQIFSAKWKELCVPTRIVAEHENTFIQDKVTWTSMDKRDFYAVVQGEAGKVWEIWEKHTDRMHMLFSHKDFSAGLVCRTPTALRKLIKYVLDNPKVERPYTVSQKEIGAISANGNKPFLCLSLNVASFQDNTRLAHFTDFTWLK